MKQRLDHIQGLAYATIGALVLSPDGLLIRLVGSSEWVIVFWRGLFVAFGMFVVQLLQHKNQILKKFPPQNMKEWLSSALCALGLLTFVMAIKHTTVANTLVILSTMSMFAALLSMIFLHERIALRTWIAMAASMLGIAVVFMDGLDSGGMLGNLYALASAFVNAANLTVIRSERTLNVPSTLAFGGVLAAAIALCFASSVSIDTRATSVLVAMGVVNALGFLLLGAGAKRIPAPEVALLFLLETIIGPFWVWLVMQETPSVNTLVGGAIVISSLVLHAVAGLHALRKMSSV